MKYTGLESLKKGGGGTALRARTKGRFFDQAKMDGDQNDIWGQHAETLYKHVYKAPEGQKMMACAMSYCDKGS